VRCRFSRSNSYLRELSPNKNARLRWPKTGARTKEEYGRAPVSSATRLSLPSTRVNGLGPVALRHRITPVLPVSETFRFGLTHFGETACHQHAATFSTSTGRHFANQHEPCQGRSSAQSKRNVCNFVFLNNVKGCLSCRNNREGAQKVPPPPTSDINWQGTDPQTNHRWQPASPTGREARRAERAQ